jgi:hyperosmotically inducible periplasmic protein
MKIRFAGLIAIAAIAVSLSGCNPSTSEYSNTPANANVNANANANVAVATTNTNANTNSRKAPTREDYESNKEKYAREAKEGGRTIGNGINDGWLWTKTRFDLAAADDLRDSTINVDLNNGVVTLTGTVANAAQKTKAESVAKAVDGVTSVKNMLKVVPNANANANANSNVKKK